MKNTKLILLGLFILISKNLWAQDPNFHIYICFGQSNMEGQGTIESQDLTVNSRFKTYQALNCSNLSRTKGNWYTATPPTCQCYSKLSPADYFGRTMVANLPDSITIGIINVAIGGCDIRLFDKDIYQDYDSTYNQTWFTSKVQAYNWNPYQYLIDLASTAKQDGVIKGILLHQGETNTGQAMWPAYVKKIYNDMLGDLSLNANSVPLLAGQVFSGSGNCCSSMNTIINRLPDTLSTAHVISSAGCQGQDNAHFNSEGYRILGRRYATKMLSLLGYQAFYAELECGVLGNNYDLLADNGASNLVYISGKNGTSNSTAAPSDPSNIISIDITLPKDTTYYLYGRLNNLNTTSDALWIKVDNGPYELFDNLTTSGWEWKEIKTLNLTAGNHTILAASAEDGTKMDKLVLKNAQIAPVGIGEESANLCQPVLTSLTSKSHTPGYSLNQNFPNPVTGSNTSISFQLPKSTFVSLKIFDSMGIEVVELAGKEYAPGEHTAVFVPSKNMPSGSYFIKLQTPEFSASRTMVILNK